LAPVPTATVAALICSMKWWDDLNFKGESIAAFLRARAEA
jgi:hypothetical protein